MTNFIKGKRPLFEEMSQQEYDKLYCEVVLPEATKEQTENVLRFFNLDKQEVDDAPYRRAFKIGDLEMLEKAVAEKIVDPTKIIIGHPGVNLDASHLVDFILEHDEKIMLLFKILPYMQHPLQIQGIALKKDASEKLISDLEKFRRNNAKNNKHNKGKKHQIEDYIVCRWDLGVMQRPDKVFVWR